MNYKQEKHTVQVTLYRKLALLILEKLTDPKFRINKLDNGISKIFPVVALIRKFFESIDKKATDADEYRLLDMMYLLIVENNGATYKVCPHSYKN